MLLDGAFPGPPAGDAPLFSTWDLAPLGSALWYVLLLALIYLLSGIPEAEFRYFGM